jgi:hypothetical protein
MMQRSPAYRDQVVELAYPNLALVGADGRRCALLTHGHFVEPAYQAMSTLATILFADPAPATVDELEEENGTWIDFFWSLMGSCGQVGQSAEMLYECLQTEVGRQRLVDRMAHGLAHAQDIDLPGVGDWLEERLARSFLNVVASWIGRQERGDATRSLSAAAEQGLRDYVEGPLHRQVNGARGLAMAERPPDEWLVIFGHTHKPFAEERHYAGYPGGVEVYNTGGWVVESDASSFLHGASVVVMDEHLAATSIRLYAESDAGPTTVRAHAVRSHPDGPSALHAEVEARLARSAGTWAAFARAADEAVHVRQRHLRNRHP